MKTFKVKNGFTLIELMITVAIVGVLASLALPAYQDYTIKVQVAEALSLSSGFKPIVEEFYATTGRLPTKKEMYVTGEETGYWGNLEASNVTGKYVSEVTFGAMEEARFVMIYAYFGENANSILRQNDGTVGILGYLDDESDNLTWVCAVTHIPMKYMPNNCVEYFQLRNKLMS